MTRRALGVGAAVVVLAAGPRLWLAAGPFVLLLSATLCLQMLGALLRVRPRRVGAFVLAGLAPLVSIPLACFWLWTEALRALPESPQRLGQATLITLAVGPGFAGLAGTALWLGQRRRANAAAARAPFLA